VKLDKQGKVTEHIINFLLLCVASQLMATCNSGCIWNVTASTVFE